MIRTYSELSRLPTFKERYEYLRLKGKIGEETFGFDRYINQIFYKSEEWKQCRKAIILRDSGFDLGCKGFEIGGKILIHHMNPITLEDIINHNPIIFDPEYLISVSQGTHNAIHYGDESLIEIEPVERSPNDTCPWKTTRRSGSEQIWR